MEQWRQLGNRSREGQLLLNLGSLYGEWREYEQAEAYLRQASDCFLATSNWLDLASAQNELGRIYTELGQWEQALTLLTAVAQRRQLENNRDSLGAALHSIGYLHLMRGDLVQAQDNLQQSLLYQETDANQVDVQRDLGLIAQIEGDLGTAQHHYTQALQIAERLNRREMLAAIHYHLAEVWRRLEQPQVAFAHYYAAVDVIETARTPLQEEALKISLLGRWQQIYETLVLYCLEQARPDEAFQWAERARARSFADVLVRKATGTDATSTQSPMAFPATVVSVAALQASLPADMTLLLYFTTGVVEREMPMWQHLAEDHPLRTHLLTPAHTLFFVVTAQSFVYGFCPIDPNLFVATTANFGEVDFLFDPDVLVGMSACLVDPVRNALVGERVSLVPHGPLHLLPFDLLFDALPCQLAYTPSATIFWHHLCQSAVDGNRQPRSAGVITIGYNTDFLHHAEAEAEFVAQLLSGRAWIGPHKKKAALCQAVRQSSLLHIACHGEFNLAEPMKSYIQIAEGERLTAEEIAQTWQLQARLVVLSACQSGVVRVLRGDEQMGLVRAFLAAGARAVLVTRWRVADAPTFLLMRQFYTYLQQTEAAQSNAALDLRTALRAAQAWLRQLSAVQVRQLLPELPLQDLAIATNLSEEQPFAHPQYWAAFMLVGND